MVSKENIEQSAITAIVTFVVTTVGIVLFDINAAVYSGVAAGLSVTVGKEYGDSLVVEGGLHWHDVVPAGTGVIIGLLAFIILYLIR